MMASRGMGNISPSKMPKGKKVVRKDNPNDVEVYKEGGKTKSKVNAAGNYTKPNLRKRIFNSVKAAAIVGTGAGQWSARKAQVMAKRYKAAGGGYRD
jgi:putative N-acetylmannosamine-6-phosphate epimerase